MSAASQINPPRDAIALLWRHKTIIVLWPLTCLVLAGLFYVFCPRKYQSEARLFVRVGRESVGIDPAATTGQTMPLYTADRKDEVRSAQEVFKSRAVAAAVVDSLGPDVVLGQGSESEGSSLVTYVTKPIGWVTDWIAGLDPISERELAIITVERSLNVGGEQQATTIVLNYVANSPQLAQDVCRTIVAIGQQEYMRVHRSEQSKPFFTEQQNRLREQLDESLENLRTAKNEMGFSSIEQRRTTLEAQYSAVELDRLSTDQQLATSQARIDDLQKQIAGIPEREVAAKKSLPNQGADLLRNRLYDLQVKSMDLGARYNESHPLLLAVNEQLSEAQKVLAEQSDLRVETSDEINPIHRQLLLTMKQEVSVTAGLKARLRELEKQKTAVLAELRAVNQHDLTIDKLTRETELARDKYMQYARTMEEVRIDAELQNENINNLSEAQPATLTEKPVTPSKTLTAAGTIALALGGTVGLVLLRESGSPTYPPLYSAVATREPRPRRRLKQRYGKAMTNGQAAEPAPSPK